MATEFSVDAVRDFIAANDGKVKNQVLVAHFKKFLSDPSKKSEARQKFKDYVNAVAVVKAENGEKHVQLKKKYRTQTSTSSLSIEDEPPEVSSSQGSPSHNLVSSFDAPIVPEDEKPVLHSYGPPIPYADSATLTPVEESTNDENDGVLTFGPPITIPVPNQVDPTITSPEQPKQTDPIKETPLKKIKPPAHNMDPSGVFRMPFPPAERRPLADMVKRSSQTGSVGSTEHGRQSFQNNSEDAVSIMQSEASVDSNKENDFEGSNFAMDPTEKLWMLQAAKGNMLELRKLLNKDPNLAEKRDFVFGYTALHWAAKKGNEDLVRMFIDIGVDVNVISNGGYTPMHLAAMNGHEKIVQILLEECEADPHIRNYSGKLARDYLRVGSISLPMQKLLFGNDGKGSVRDFAAGLRPRLDSVRKSKRLGNAISGGVGVLGALVRGKATSNEDVSSIASSSPSIGRKGSFSSKGKKKKSRKWSKDERPSISLISASDDMDSGFGSWTSTHAHEGMRRGHSSSPQIAGPHRRRGDSVASKQSYNE